MYYGQCSELCGVQHGFMPIVVKAVKQEAFVKFYCNKFSLS
jgi:cytochrome c oxidase subunit 2